MNVTESRFKNRQLHMEDYLQMVSAEQKEYAEVFDYSKSAEKGRCHHRLLDEQSFGFDFAKGQSQQSL